MPDYSFIANPQTSSSLQSLSSIMNTANAAQQFQMNRLNIQQKQETLPSDIARVKAESELAQQTLGPKVEAQKSAAQTAAEQAQQQRIVTIRAHVANGASQLADMYGTGATPDAVRANVTNTLTNAGAHPDAIAQAVNAIPNDPSKVDGYIVHLMKGSLDTVTQLDKQFPAPAMVNQGQYQVPVASGNPALTNVQPGQIQGMAIKNQIAPAQQNITGTDAQGRPIVTTIDPNTTQVTGVSGIPVMDRQNATPPAVLPLGKTQAQLDQYTTRQQQVSDAAAGVPDQHYANSQIKMIMDQGGTFAPTGSNSAFVAKLGSMIGQPLGADEASNINSINHFLARKTQENEKAMGVSTDAGRAVSAAAEGSAVQDPISLRRTVNIQDASSSALDFYNRGKEAAIKSYQGQPGMGVFAQQDFQNAWTQAYGRYGPYAMRLMNAGATGDKAEAAAVQKELGGKKSPQFQQMLFDANKLDKLATTGHQ
jgi:hypothetical protein